MNLMELFDNIPLSIYLLLAILGMILLIEFGYRGGMYHRGKPDKAQMAQVRAIMGASLGLLAFMLAFSFAVAQQHYEARTDAYLLEITAIDAAYRGASLLDDVNGNVPAFHDRDGLPGWTHRQAQHPRHLDPRGYLCSGIGPGHGSGSPAKPPVQDEPGPDDRTAEPHQSVIEACWLF